MEFTKEELEVVISYIERKVWHLEDSNLEDSYCYPRLSSFLIKLKKIYREKFGEICLQNENNMI